MDERKDDNPVSLNDEYQPLLINGGTSDITLISLYYLIKYHKQVTMLLAILISGAILVL